MIIKENSVFLMKKKLKQSAKLSGYENLKFVNDCDINFKALLNKVLYIAEMLGSHSSK